MKVNSKTTKYSELSFAFLMSILFAGAVRQMLLFSHNQNTYLLQGVSRAIDSPLRSDWLANQTDHLQLFTYLVEISYSISPVLFYLLQGLLTIILMFSLYVIATSSNVKHSDKTSIALFFLFFFFAKRYLNALGGVADQYILGSFFQPSSFGVLLIASIALFISKKHVTAICACILAAYFHPTYILQSAILVLTYQLILLNSKDKRGALILGVLALCAISPLLYGLYEKFGNLPLGLVERSQEILVFERIPHHAIVSEWLISKSTAQSFIIIAAAIALYRKNVYIVMILVVPLILTIVFVTVASLSNNLTMLLLFGHRSSVWLVPIASSLVIIRISSFIEWHTFLRVSRKIILHISVFALFTFFALGTGRTIHGHYNTSANNLYTFLSSLEYGNGSLLIPIYRHNIRLNAMVPVFVDWKSHPYKADEVIEWYSRITLARKFYESRQETDKNSAFLELVDKEEIAFVLMDSRHPIAGCTPIYIDQKSIVYSATTCFSK